MINRLNDFFIFFILILPITLITGSAIPDLTVTFSAIFFLFSIFIHKSYKRIYNNIFVKFSIIYYYQLLDCISLNHLVFEFFYLRQN